MAEHTILGGRTITSDEIEHYKNHGWVKLEGLFEPATIAGILSRAKARMGEDPSSVSRSQPDSRVPNEYKWYARWDGCSHSDEWLYHLSHSLALAKLASLLMVSPVRFYFDHVFAKIPASNGGSETPWHQDLPHHPLDRQGALTIWIPLIDCPPEMGTLRFLSGSHRAGLLGRYLNRNDGICLADENPWVLDQYKISPPLHLRAGDATVHNLAIVHRAPENATALTRWVYTTQWLPLAARYTGAPNHRTDGLGLAIDQPLDHPRFPVIPT